MTRGSNGSRYRRLRRSRRPTIRSLFVSQGRYFRQLSNQPRYASSSDSGEQVSILNSMTYSVTNEDDFTLRLHRASIPRRRLKLLQILSENFKETTERIGLIDENARKSDGWRSAPTRLYFRVNNDERRPKRRENDSNASPNNRSSMQSGVKFRRSVERVIVAVKI